MRQWITAGFITEKDESKTLEEVAEGYLAELVNRSLLQVVERNFAGRLKPSSKAPLQNNSQELCACSGFK